jgi:hypothetical protein
MAGKKGMLPKPNTDSVRQKMWRSMRILKRFDIPAIMRTVPGATYTNALKLFKRLEKLEVIGRTGKYTSGRAGEYQAYCLLKDAGPDIPVIGFDTGSNKPPTTNNEGNIL